MSLSGDGSVVIFGGPSHRNGEGATWAFRFNNRFSRYVQIDNYFIGTGAVGPAGQGQCF